MKYFFDQVNDRPAFHVERNKNYRFRIAHSGGDIQCAIGCQISGHKLRVIALDGNPIEPVHAFQIVLVPGSYKYQNNQFFNYILIQVQYFRYFFRKSERAT